ncbi:unnamed protein product [Sphagnum jensenii]
MLTVHSSTTVPAARCPSGSIDLEASIKAATQAIYDLAKADAAYTARIGEAALEAWNDDSFRFVKSIGLSALTRMALVKLKILPDETNYRDALVRLRMVIASSPDKFLMPKSGNNSNVYLLSRHTTAEIEKLKKS